MTTNHLHHRRDSAHERITLPRLLRTLLLLSLVVALLPAATRAADQNDSIGTAGPWGPCYMCHTFTNGTADERAWFEKQQNELRDRLAPAFKRWYKLTFNVDLDKELSVGGGSVIDLDRLPTPEQAWGSTDPSTGDITLNALSLAGQAILTQHILLHETGHRSSLQAFGNTQGDEAVPTWVMNRLNRWLSRDLRAGLYLTMWDGFVGVALEQMVFGNVLSYK